MSNSLFNFQDAPIKVNSDKVTYNAESIETNYTYRTSSVDVNPATGGLEVTPKETPVTFKTNTKVPKCGLMLVGLGGNNGTTLTAGLLANKHNITWETKEGTQKPDFLGSLCLASTVRLGSQNGREVYVPFSRMLPLVNPNDLVVGGWDISKMNLGDAMKRAKVLPADLQRNLYSKMKAITPLPSIYYPDFIASNQEDRADNALEGTKAEHLAQIRKDIRDFKAANGLDKVIVLWSANTERFSDHAEGVHDTIDNLLAAIERGEEEVAPSAIFATASIQEGCTFINGSPQNTFSPAIVALARKHGVYIAGDDFKSGQTKIKSVLVDFLVSAGIKPVSIVSYNHLGNNDGKNLAEHKCFRSKEISKSNVVDDMVASNGILYDLKNNEHPDHTVVIKYVPFVGDSKRALDEYTSKIFMGGLNTISMHNTCEDSLLAAPLILDLVLLAELCERIQINVPVGEEEAKEAAAAEGEEDKKEECAKGQKVLNWHPVLSLLSFLLKAPLVPEGTPVINALFRQREAITNLLRACIGLPPNNNMLLEHKVDTAGLAYGQFKNAASSAAGASADTAESSCVSS